ncbi:MAG TPA: hypothetical protein VFF52_03185, partial [Isosphaeraceae bacterium]|nr:hypothetical protein [Isosphaeraceae bacterium]
MRKTFFDVPGALGSGKVAIKSGKSSVETSEKAGAFRGGSTVTRDGLEPATNPTIADAIAAQRITPAMILREM